MGLKLHGVGLAVRGPHSIEGLHHALLVAMKTRSYSNEKRMLCTCSICIFKYVSPRTFYYHKQVLWLLE